MKAVFLDWSTMGPDLDVSEMRAALPDLTIFDVTVLREGAIAEWNDTLIILVRCLVVRRMERGCFFKKIQCSVIKRSKWLVKEGEFRR